MMTTAPTQPLISGNPGIVPPWLQGAGRPVTPPATSPAPAVTPSPTVPVPGSIHAGAQAARDAIGYIPRADGSVIVVEIPDGPGAARSIRGGSLGSVRFDMTREQQRLEQTVADVQAKYAAHGITAAEGNGPVVARFEPRFHNAAYAPEGIKEFGSPADSITVGVDPRSNTPFAKAEDVVAHELAHRVIDHMTHGKLSLQPTSEDVAIHESLADTFASMMVDTDDWQIGEDLGEPVRVMDHPDRLGHPGTVADLTRVLAPGSEFMHPIELSNGDVARDRRTGDPVEVPDWHVVAGIPNKAATMIGNELGRDKLSDIYLKAVRENLRPGQEIEGLAVAVMQSAKDLYGASSHEFQATKDAWDAVGVLDLVKKQAAEQQR